MGTSRWFSFTLVALLALGAFADVASAQRRRRRRRPRRSASMMRPTPRPTPPDAGSSALDDNPFDMAGARPAPAPVAEPAPPPPTPQPPARPRSAPPAAAPTEAPVAPDLEPVREDFTAIMDELVQVRARVAVLGRQLFQTRVRIEVQNRADDDYVLERITVRLDGAPVFRADASELAAESGAEIYDGFAAPGPHVLTIEAEHRSRVDDAYRYSVRDAYRFQVTQGRMTEVSIVFDDDSNIADDFADDGEGEYDVRTRVRVATRALEAR